MPSARAVSSAEGHRLGVLVREALVGGVGEEQLAPPGMKTVQGGVLRGAHRLQHLRAQQPAQPRRAGHQRVHRRRRRGGPRQEAHQQVLEVAPRRRQCGASGSHVTDQGHHLAHPDPRAVEGELSAVGVEHVGQTGELLPLLPVVLGARAGPLRGVRALPGGLHLHVPGQRPADLDLVVRAHAQRREGLLPQQHQVLHPGVRRDRLDQDLERTTDAVLLASAVAEEARGDLGAERRDGDHHRCGSLRGRRGEGGHRGCLSWSWSWAPIVA